MMKKYFATHKQALALKELGFDEPCLAYWNISPHLKNPAFIILKPFEHEWCLPAPLKSQVFEWFRKEYKMFSQIIAYEGNEIPQFKGDIAYFVEIDLLVGLEELEKPFKTYEEAESACIDKLIKLLKKDKHAMY